MSEYQYVPVLKGRLGEYGALEMSTPEAKAHLCPVIEIPPVPWDHARNQPAQALDTHLRKVSAAMERAWGCTLPVLIDLMWIEGTEMMANGSHPAAYLFGALRNRGVLAIPVTGLVRDDEYQRTYVQIVQQDCRGACVRLQREDFEAGDLGFQIEQLLSRLNISERNADLILDMRAIDAGQPIEDVVTMIDQLPNLTSWRSFSICGTGFPPDLMGLPPQAISTIPRTEWTLWTQLVSTRSLPRIPSFGDYAVANPQPSEVDPRVMRPSASIRYTTRDSWLILKGQNLRDHGFRQFHQVSQALVDFPQYTGPEFSWGDSYIRDCARRVVGTGNLTTWRKVGTSHHLAFVLRQLANLSAS